MAEKPRVSCPRCGRRYRWKPELAGRAVACGCGQKMMLPQQPHGEPKPINDPDRPSGESMAGEYELDVPDTDAERAHPEPGERPSKCPQCNSPLKPAAVICLNCGFDVDRGRVIRTQIASEPDDADEPDPRAPAGAAPATGEPAETDTSWIDRWLTRGADGTSPTHAAWIAAGSMAVLMATTLWQAESPGAAAAEAALLLVAPIFWAPIFLVALVLSRLLLGVSLGPVGQALVKLAAMALCTLAIGNVLLLLIGWIPVLGPVLALVAMFLTAVGMIESLFEVELRDAAFMTFIIVGSAIATDLAVTWAVG